MPTFEITDPNTGRTLEITGDSPPTEAELEEIFAQVQPAPAAAPAEQPGIAERVMGAVREQPGTIPALGLLGGTQLGRDILSRAVEGESEEERAQREALLEGVSPRRRAELEAINPFEAALLGIGRGFRTVGRGTGLEEAIGLQPPSPAEEEAIEQLRELHPVSTAVGEVVGEAAPFVPAGLGAGAIRSTLARVPTMAGVGATEAGIIARGQGADLQQQLFSAGLGGTVAGALEVGLPFIGRIGGKLIRKFLGKAPEGAVIDATGQPSQEFVEALAESGQTMDDVVKETAEQFQKKAVDPKEAARKAFLESQGIDPTKAQISRTADDFMAQQEAAKTSTAVRDALEKQNAHLTSRFNNEVFQTGGTSANQSNTVFDFITDKATQLDQEISDLYRAARQTLPADKNIRFERLATKLRELLPADRRSGGNIKAIIGEMQAKQIFDKKGKLVGQVNVEVAEDLRKAMNELYDEKNPFGNMLLRKLKDALDDDVMSTAGQDFFKQARKAKADFEKGLSRSKISKFDMRKDNLVRDILENKVNPDQIADKVVFSKRWRPDDLQQLKDYISTDEVGKEAFNDLRAEVMEKIKDRAFTGAADQLGNPTLSRSGLEKALKSMGAKKRNILFTAEENKFLNDMLEVSKLREPVPGTALGRGPSAQAIFRLERKLKDMPMMGKVFEIVDVEGRAALRAKPKRLPVPTPALPQAARATIPAAAALTAQQQEQQ